MFQRQRSLILACALVVAAPLPADAQQPPNLLGLWKGMGTGVQVGPTLHRPAAVSGVKFPDNEIEFTYVITEQHGNRFAGQMSSAEAKETIIGALSPDNRSGLMLDDDGLYQFMLVEADTMDVCYSHFSTKGKFVGCMRLRRER
jgi:hypothetical protein